MQQCGFLFLFRQKTVAGTFLFEIRNAIFLKVVLVIQVRPQNLIGKASAH